MVLGWGSPSGNEDRKEKVVPMRTRILLLGLLALFLVGGLCFVLLRGEAEAGLSSDLAESSVTDLRKYVEGGAAPNLKMLALETMRKSSDAGVEDELVTIAKGRDLRMAIYAATTLGRRKSSDSKSALKDLVTNGKLGTEVRKGAMTAIAVHWKDAGDLSWLKSKTADDATLSGHAGWLEDHVYGK